MKKIFLSIFFISISISIWSCANAHLFKVFPIGMNNDTIISIDIDIQRRMAVLDIEEQPVSDSSLIIPNFSTDVVWYITSYITKYDQYQRPFIVTLADSVTVSKNECDEELKLIYDRTFKKATAENPEMKLFHTKSISFGGFSNKHKDIEIKDNRLFYKKKHYPIEIAKDSTYYGLDPNNYFGYERIAPIGSVRKYTLDNTELVIIHTQAGDEFHKPKMGKVRFENVSNTIYMEPILHHGNGIDYFIVVKKNK